MLILVMKPLTTAATCHRNIIFVLCDFGHTGDMGDEICTKQSCDTV
jgi:hypothetical protein